jgi:2-polyprenyl-3-methyl-5-hydroxy-6-metoxy-1,4-benzoquinol methylase
MSELWDETFKRSQLMWGLEPTASALFACDHFSKSGAKDVLIPGVGYGRNAKPFLERGMSVTGIEISETAIGFARSKLGLGITIHHGSVLDMPFDEHRYDAVFCFGLIYLLDAAGRAKLLRDCMSQLAPNSLMIFTVISKEFEMYGKGTKLGEDWYEIHPGIRMYFYDDDSIRREFGPHGLVEITTIAEPMHDGSTRPFVNVMCKSKA